MVDLSKMSVRVEHRFAAGLPQVWALLSDLPRMGTSSPEVAELRWDAEPGGRFTATNRRGGRTWTVPCHVVTAEPPHLLRWTVLDPASPSSTWEYRLSADGSGTRVVHTFRHGPGPSLVRATVEADPASYDRVVAGRSTVLAEDMAASLRAADEALRASGS